MNPQIETPYKFQIVNQPQWPQALVSSPSPMNEHFVWTPETVAKSYRDFVRLRQSSLHKRKKLAPYNPTAMPKSIYSIFKPIFDGLSGYVVWTSTVLHDGSTEWIKFCIATNRESWVKDRPALIYVPRNNDDTIAPKSRIAVLRDMIDLLELWRCFHHDRIPSKDLEFPNTNIVDFRAIPQYIDRICWLCVSKKFDAVHFAFRDCALLMTCMESTCWFVDPLSIMNFVETSKFVVRNLSKTNPIKSPPVKSSSIDFNLAHGWIIMEKKDKTVRAVKETPIDKSYRAPKGYEGVSDEERVTDYMALYGIIPLYQ